MAQFKAICEVEVDNDIQDRVVFIKNAKDEADAEKQAKTYMIEQQPESGFNRVIRVVKV